MRPHRTLKIPRHSGTAHLGREAAAFSNTGGASCDPFRDVPFLEKALCRWWLSGAGLQKALAKILPQLETEIVKRSDRTRGFVVLPRRWVVERTFAWLNRCRRLAKDCWHDRARKQERQSFRSMRRIEASRRNASALRFAAIAILDIGRMNDGVQQQTHRVYENMALLPLDLFARVIAMRIDAAPPFSALFTLWLSTMAAVGLASLSPCSRHAT